VIGDMVGLPDNRSETCERRSAGCLGIDPAKPKLAQIEFVDKDVNHPNGIVLANPVFQAFWKQCALPAIRPLNKSLHPIPRKSCGESYRGNQFRRCVFTQPRFIRDGNNKRRKQFEMTDFWTTADEIPALPCPALPCPVPCPAPTCSRDQPFWVGRGQHLPETGSTPGSWLLFV
jgi:hypothetical protein